MTAKSRKKRRRQRSLSSNSEHPSQILSRLLLKPLWITEKDISRQATALEALLLQLWLKALAGKHRAFKLWILFRQFVPSTDAKAVDICFEDDIETTPDSVQLHEASGE